MEVEKQVEHEFTYLIKEIPAGLKECEHMEITDIYIPESFDHPKIRIRKRGDSCKITKKVLVNEDDKSKFHEQTIPITEEEFNALQNLPSKKVRKIRYYYPYKGSIAEIDIFQDALKGLITAEVEFKNTEEKATFPMPEFCLADITPEDFIAGGMVCGKSYEDLALKLESYKYKKLFLD